MTSSPTSLPLHGQTALVTGVSRRRGIGFAVARALAQLGADLQDTDNIQPLVHAAHALTGSLDILVCNHAKSGGDGSILDMTPEALDAFWRTNTRSTLLLTRAFALLKSDVPREAARPGDRLLGGASRARFSKPIGRVFWLTSGQGHGPMRGEVAYATSKAALAGVTATVAAELLELGVVLNTVNPGPVDTGYLTPESTDRSVEGLQELMDRTPFARLGEPDDPARLISWLATDSGAWIVGQVLTSDGGFYLA